MSKLRSGLAPVARATGAPPTIDDLRARRSRRRSRRIATTSASAVGLASVVAVALSFGGGPTGKTMVNTAHRGDTVSSVPTRPDGRQPAQHPSASTLVPPADPTTVPPTTTQPDAARRPVPTTTTPATTTPPSPTLNPGEPPPNSSPPAPGTPSAPTITSVTLGPIVAGVGPYGTEESGGSPGKGTAQVAWAPPLSDGGSPITSYWVQSMYASTGDTGPGFRVGPETTTFLVKGLLPDRPALFYVEAWNAVGPGTSSLASNTVTAPRTTPNVPLVRNPAIPNNNAATPGNGSATMTWEAPIFDGGSAVTGYLVRSLRSDGTPGPTCTAGASATSCVVGGLTNGTSYTFRVLATNALGLGDPSIVSNAVTPRAP